MNNLKFALISLGGTSSLKVLEEAKKYFSEVDNINIKKIEVHASTKGLDVFYENKHLQKYDCIYLRGSYKYALLQRSITKALFSKCYMPLAPSTFTIGHDKFLTSLELVNNKIDIPKTHVCANTESAKKLLEKVNYPIIMKIPSGTQGKGVMFADSLESAKSILDTLEVFKQPYMIQEYIETNATDIRAIVVGDKVVASMKRKALDNERRANIHMGGIGLPYELEYDAEQLAIKSAKALNADICAVDILEGKKPVVIEVNLSPGLKGIMNVTQKNIPDKIAKFLYEKTLEFKKNQKNKDYDSMMDDLKLTNVNDKEILLNLDIKAGMIKLPPLVSKLSGFKNDEEVVIKAEKGKVIIEQHKI